MLFLFMVSDAILVNIFPTDVDPVKLSFLTFGRVASVREASLLLVVTTCRHELAIPAFKASFARDAAKWCLAGWLNHH